jgi:hypothetical protein
VRVDVGSRTRSWAGRVGRPAGQAGLRSLPAKQHAPKARPTTRHRPWPAGGLPGRPSSANGHAAGPARRRGAGHSRLTAGHRARAAPPRPGRAGRQPGRGEEASSPRDPPPRHDRNVTGVRALRGSAGRPGVTTRWARERRGGWRPVRNGAWRTERNARLACSPCCYDPLVPRRVTLGSSRLACWVWSGVTNRLASQASRPGGRM